MANVVGITHKSKSSLRDSMIIRVSMGPEAKKHQVCCVAPSRTLPLGPALQDTSHSSNTRVFSVTVKQLFVLSPFFNPSDSVKEKAPIRC